MDHEFDQYLKYLEERDSVCKGVNIFPHSFDYFKVVQTESGMIDLAGLAKLHRWIRDTLRLRYSQTMFIIQYHPKSPDYVFRSSRISKPRVDEDADDPTPIYRLAIDLEDLMESESAKKYGEMEVDFIIPDNYELAAKALKEFGEETGITDISDSDSYREVAVFTSKNPAPIKAMAEYIQKKYLGPILEQVFKDSNIKDIKFLKKRQYDIIYNENTPAPLPDPITDDNKDTTATEAV